MQTVRGLEISPKVLLGEEAFIKYKRENRKWYAILCMALVSIFIMVAFAIINKELELGIYIGALLFVYCIPLGVLASKNKSSPAIWVLFTLFFTPVLGFVFSHALMTRKGFKHEWL
ncbi:hypothetical protein [Shewanella baltica]|jgi:4-hydroxybenzoate polyprenyltransferase|uniref:hypothetical protein n=1 Tax=Shewanella baltica TaxID=62322 RepID=UPI003D792F98